MTSIIRKVAAAAVSCAAMLAPLAASAVPAYPGLIKMTQPDGSEITVQLRGDENHHITLTEDGYLLATQQGAYYYANLDKEGRVVASPYMAKEKSMRTPEEMKYLSTLDMETVYATLSEQREAVMATRETVSRAMSPARVAPLADADEKGYGLFAGATYPVTGKQKGLVILVEYQDTRFNTGYNAYDYFSRMLNEKDFSMNGGTGSARDFFMENSGGKFDIEFDVYGPVLLPNNVAYYGANDAYGDKDAWRMIVDACQILEPEVDFTQYDRDGDGRIDNVFCFYAGKGEATGGGDDTVWPHAFYVTTKGTYRVDGKIIDRYACTNEWETIYKGGGRPDGVGTFIHEFSHVMGLPDLYTTAYNPNCFTPGQWSCLDMGPYNNEGRTPPLYGMFELNALGWRKPTEITGAMNGRLKPIGSGDGYIINTTRPQEFFLLENRQQTSWDRYLPGNGMLVWHVLYNVSIWSSNSVNNTPSIQYVDIEEADNVRTEATRANDAFPGTEGQYTEFTDETQPSMLTWQKKSLGLPITDIAMTNGVITFKVAGGRPEVNATEALESSNVTPGGFTAVWKGVEGDYKYAVNVYTKDAAGTRTYADGLYLRLVDGTSLTTDVLEPLTTYYWNVCVYDSGINEYSEESNELSFTTLEATTPEYMRPVLDEISDVADDAFTINWHTFEGASSYFVNVFTKRPVDLKTDVCGFDDYTSPTYFLPQGWTTNVKGNFTNDKYSGVSAPSMKMTVNGQYVQSPVYSGSSSVCGIKFWHRGVTANDDNTISVQALIDGEWRTVKDLTICYDATGETVEVTNFPALAASVRLVFNRKSTGSLAVDDVEVSYANGEEAVAVLTDMEVAAPTTSYAVTGLAVDTYYFTVAAVKDGVRTRPSLEARINLGNPNASIDIVGSDNDINVIVDGNVITVGEDAVVFDALGRLVGRVSAGGSLKVATGIYVVRTSTGSAKIAVK